jgi:hypothetical protein
MQERWTTLVKAYLSDRNPAWLTQAIAAAQAHAEPAIASLLTAFQHGDETTVWHWAPALWARPHEAGRVEEADTIAWLEADLHTCLLGRYPLSPPQERVQVLQHGLEACTAALHRAARDHLGISSTMGMLTPIHTGDAGEFQH